MTLKCPIGRFEVLPDLESSDRTFERHKDVK